MDKRNIIFIICLILINILLVEATKENCKIIFDKKLKKYVLQGKCNDGIYYVNNLDGKKSSELNYDICAEKGSITRYVVASGKIYSSSCVNIKDNSLLREKSIIISRSGSDEGEQSYKLFADKSHTEQVDGSSPAYLFICNTDNTECTEITNIGYYVNNKNSIFACYNNNNNEIKCSKIPSETSCTTETIGKIYYEEEGTQVKFYVCLNYDGDNVVKIDLSDNAGNYFVPYAPNNIYGITLNKYAIVNINRKSIVLSKNQKKYAYVDKSNKYKILMKGDECPSDINNDMIEFICNNEICSSNS
jgi:hypothetical protein